MSEEKNVIGMNEEFEQLKLQHGFLKEQCATQLELYNHLVEVVGPNLQAQYTIHIGQYEHRVFELKTEVARWKRRFTLRQQALNRGEKPDLASIEVQLDEEFVAYIEEIKKHIEELKQASALYHSEKFSAEETAELRSIYLDAVKKLHPDLNPDLPPEAVKLWNQIQQANKNNDLQQMRFLIALVDDVVRGKTVFVKSEDGLTALRKACEKLRKHLEDITARTASLRATAPFTYEPLLCDEKRVHERQAQLTEQIKALQECIDQYAELWNNGK